MATYPRKNNEEFYKDRHPKLKINEINDLITSSMHISRSLHTQEKIMRNFIKTDTHG